MKSYIILRGQKPQRTWSQDFTDFTEGVSGTLGELESTGVDDKPPEISVERLPEQALRELDDEPGVSHVEVMPTILIDPPANAPAGPDPQPSWGIAAVGADTSPYTGVGVTVAVLDTGIQADHPAFQGVDLKQEDFTTIGNGDVKGHGTHCAGTIFGRDVNGCRIGIARGVGKALIGKVMRDDGKGDSGMIFNALKWAAQKGANIISMSLGFDFPGKVAELQDQGYPPQAATSIALVGYRAHLAMFDALMAQMRAGGSFGNWPLVVAAAGNESKRDAVPRYVVAASLPAAATDVVSVAAVGQQAGKYKMAPFSNVLASIGAPGVDILSAWPGNALHVASGTSMACPHVAGVAALWWQALKQSGTTPSAASVGARLFANARKNQLDASVREQDIGQGMVSAPPAP